ncbi:MAG: hypothetical protein ACI4KM_10145 [Oscillospiraceae bacterium]
MVWESSQSPLYKAVETFNSAAQKCDAEAVCNSTESCVQQQSHITSCSHDSEQPECPQCAHKPKITECPHKNDFRANPLQTLLADKDMLLIAALIIILIHEKADMKIIIALGLILLI